MGEDKQGWDPRPPPASAAAAWKFLEHPWVFLLLANPSRVGEHRLTSPRWEPTGQRNTAKYFSFGFSSVLEDGIIIIINTLIIIFFSPPLLQQPAF